MIIDATTGSIARFVNHSCDPNCRMIKWIVSGQPRMALFAGDRPIMTGDELTYDYNFDPFSAKNVQKCLCGSDNCRGVLGPKPRDVKLAKTDAKKTVKTGKRKLEEMMGDEGGRQRREGLRRPRGGSDRSPRRVSRLPRGPRRLLRRALHPCRSRGRRRRRGRPRRQPNVASAKQRWGRRRRRSWQRRRCLVDDLHPSNCRPKA